MVGEAVENQIHLTNIPSVGGNITEADVEEIEVMHRVQIAFTLSFLVGVIQVIVFVIKR